MKICNVCTRTKNVNDFYTHKAVCKDCYKARQNKRYHENKTEIERVKYVSRGTQTDGYKDDVIDRLDKLEYLIFQLEISISSLRDVK